MTSTQNTLKVNKKSECKRYALKEHDVTNSDKEEAIISAIISQLPENISTKLIENEEVLLCKLSDAEIDFEKLCRTCLAVTNDKNIFDETFDGVSIRSLLAQYISISMQEDDVMPKHICHACISELVSCHEFKKKCLQAQYNLEEIIKYSNGKQGARYKENTTQIPFLLSSSKLTRFVTNEETTEFAQTKNCKERKAAISEPYTADALDQIDIRKRSEVTIQNKEETSSDGDMLFSDRNMSHYKNEEVKEMNANKQIKREFPLDCSKCGKIFETEDELENHVKYVMHPKKRSKQPCHLCGKIISAHHLTVHMRTHTKEKPYKCKICSKTFSLNCNLKRHFMIHTGEKPYICDICGKGYIQAGSLKEHIFSHTGQKPHLCEICGRGFAYHGNLNDHSCVPPEDSSLKNSSQMLEYQDRIANPEFGNKLIEQASCDVCQEVFPNRRKLRKHRLTHRDKSYLCSYCGKKFLHNSSFQIHLRIHTGDKPNSCPVCGKLFSQIGSLNSHMLIHDGKKPFNCELCSKSFTQSCHLDCHMKTHTGEKPYKCSYCNKRFALNGTLTVHVRSHTGETPYVCDVCGRGFYHSSSMKKHRRAHDNVKAFKKKNAT